MRETTAPELVFRLIRASALGFLLFTSLSAFSTDSWKAIMRRDNFSCRECNKSKKRGYTIVAAHLNHSRSYEFYDSPSNGKALDIQCHLNHHRRNAGKNGLTLEQNQMAIRKLEEKIAELKSQGKLV